MSNERSRDFGAGQSQVSGPGWAERRDSGADALLELARLIGQNDPVVPAPSRSETRLADISRTAASKADAARDSFMDRGSGRRAPEEEPRVPVPPVYLGPEPPAPSRAREGFDLPPRYDRDDYPVAPRRARPDDHDDDRGNHRDRPPIGGGRPDYGRPDDHPGEYADGDYEIELDDFEDDERGAKRRRSTRAIIAVLGLAVFGSAAAYGYRTIMSFVPSGPAPIIRADNSPTKITPMSDVRPESGRIGDRIGEQLVRRDEDPVNVEASIGSGVSGSGDGARRGANIVPAASSASPSDPKRVHTVPIRADQGTSMSDRAASRSVAPPAPPAPRQVAAPPPQPPSPPPQRQAAVAPPASPPPDTAVAAPVESGGYVVQLTAQRSEGEAQTAFRILQTKYPVLSGRQPLIRRKDQGDRGIFFAAQIGPFGAKGDADQFCEQVKSAGGPCFVQRN
jgi:cell division septation protein DedD